MKICKKCGAEKEDKKPCKLCVKARDAIKYAKIKNNTSKLDGSEMDLSQLSVRWVTGG